MIKHQITIIGIQAIIHTSIHFIKSASVSIPRRFTNCMQKGTETPPLPLADMKKLCRELTRQMRPKSSCSSSVPLSAVTPFGQ